MTERGSWNYPTSIQWGCGAVQRLPELYAARGLSRPLVVTDPGVARLALLRNLVAALSDAGLSPQVHAHVQPNPTGADIEQGVASFRSGEHDGVIAVGGGSALDAGKAIAFMAGQSRTLWDFEDRGDNYLRASTRAIAPTFAVPTTAGTGSEVGRASVVVDESTGRKVIIFHPRMLPEVAVLDPELTAGLSPSLTAATGMDALSHCLEAYSASGYHPLADGIALEGMRLARRALPRAFQNGEDLEARRDMLSAALMGATAFQKGLGAMHALSHPIGGRIKAHHGLTNAVVMPYVLLRNRSAIDERMSYLARVLELARPGFDGVLEWVLNLRSELGIPETLVDLGVNEGHVPLLSAMAAEDPAGASNPIPLLEADYARLYRSALEGDLSSS